MPQKPDHDYLFPPERAAEDELQQQAKRWRALPLLVDIFDGVPQLLMVVNEARQIVLVNQPLLGFLEADDPQPLLGMRPGELLDCLHADEEAGGCGTSEFCTTCGAARALSDSQRGMPSLRECRILRKATNEALDLRVAAKPVELDGEKYTVFAVSNIADEKRRQALERIFFHDILNTVASLQGFTELLQIGEAGDQQVFTSRLQRLSERLIDEINGQRQLLAAENGELGTDIAAFDAAQMLGDILDFYRQQNLCRRRQLIQEPGASPMLHSDPSLVGRVLGNLVKNALEATKAGGTVTAGCRELDDGVEFHIHNPRPIPRDVQLQVFQRSFSTRGVGRGLGTYGAKLLTENYLGGRIGFSSSTEEGTTFRVWLPLRHTPENP